MPDVMSGAAPLGIRPLQAGAPSPDEPGRHSCKARIVVDGRDHQV